MKNTGEEVSAVSEKCLKEQQPAQQKDEAAERKKLLIKLGSMTALAAIILVFVTVAWFTMSKNIETGSMAMTATELPFELETSGAAGLYDSYLDAVVEGYDDASTTEGTSGIKWQLTSSSNLNNLYSGSDEPDMSSITRFDSDKYGLEPGNHGDLEFTIVNKTTDKIYVELFMKLTGYKASFDEDDYKTDTALALVTDESALGFLAGHILFFYEDADGNDQLITPDGFVSEIEGSGRKTVKLHWVWPATLNEILSADIEGISTDDSKLIRRFFFQNPEVFLKPTGEVNFDDIRVLPNDDTAEWESAISSKLPLLTNKNYSRFAAMYNDADQTIGDNVNYVLAELIAGMA